MRIGSGYKVILHANDECIGEAHSHGIMKLDTNETKVMIQWVYPFVAQAPVELKFACVPMRLDQIGMNCVQEIKSIWAKKKEVLQKILEQLPDGNAKNNYMESRKDSREFAATKKAETPVEGVEFKVLGSVDRDEMLEVAKAVFIATGGIPQPVEIRFELKPDF